MLRIKKVHPTFTNIVITGERFDKDFYDGSIMIAEAGSLKLWQKVVEVGPMVKDIKIGDLVMITLENYARKKYDKNSVHNDIGDNYTTYYALNWVNIDDEEGNPVEHLLINERDVLYSFDGEEVYEEVPTKKLILPKKKKVIVNQNKDILLN